MRVIYCMVLVFCFSMQGFSQIESPNRSIKIAPAKKPEAPPKPTTEAVTPAIITYESSLEKNKDAKLLKGITLLPKKEEKSIMETEPIRNPSEIYTEKMNKKLKEEGISSGLERRDYFLGEFRVYTQTLNISCRDHQVYDGDNIRIWINGEIVKPMIGLENSFKKYSFDIKEGMNVIEIEALNMGELSPNTGQFLFQDADNKPVTMQTWDLFDGHKAIIKIVRIDNLKKEE